MNKNSKKGISLIVLVITIIVIVILAGAVILSLVNNSPISNASKATYLSDVRTFQTELEMYKTKHFADQLGGYYPKTLQADETSITYNGYKDTTKTIKTLISTLGQNDKYDGQFAVIDGQLVFCGLDTAKQEWAEEIGIEVVTIGKIGITVFPPSEMVVSSGTDITYTVKFISNAPLTTINMEDKLEVVDNDGVTLPSQPNIIIGEISGTSIDSIREVNITIKTETLLIGSYKLRIKPYCVTDVNGMVNDIDTISLIGFDVMDTTPPLNPDMSTNPSSWTNGNVSVIIIYSEDTTTKEYSIDGTNWNNYTVPVVITNNNITVYAKGKDSNGNESGVATTTITNIDKTIPTLTVANGGSTSSSVKITASGGDVGGSGINIESYQYSKDNGVTWTTATNETSYTFTGLTSGTYQCKAKVSDNAGNVKISNAIALAVLVTPAQPGAFISPTTNVARGSTITISWGDTTSWGTPTTNRNYRLEVSYNGNAYTLVSNGTTISRNFAVALLITNTNIQFRIRAESDGGQSNWVYSNSLNLVELISFAYTGNYQTWIVPETGTYRLEVWGASGGNGGGSSSPGGKGGYAVGDKQLTMGQELYIYVGQVGANYSTSSNARNAWNGGGCGAYSTYTTDSAGGGGATDIRTISGEWNNNESLLSRIIVAGGAGGGAGTNSSQGGSGGGINGGNAYRMASSVSPSAGSQTSAPNGAGFGYGADGGTSRDVNNNYFCSGGGGGGWYGGGTVFKASGGGGSGYIDGLTNSSTQNDVNTGDGKVNITFMGN